MWGFDEEKHTPIQAGYTMHHWNEHEFVKSL